VKSSRPDGHPPQHQRTSPLLHPAFTPPPLLGSTALSQACSWSSPPASPSAGVAGWARRLAGTHHLPGSRTVSNTAPSWASVVRDDAHANTKPAVLRQDFLAPYELCIDSGLRTRIVFHHQDGSHEVSISCRLCAPPVDAHAPANAHARRRRRRRKRAPVAAAVSRFWAQQPILRRPRRPRLRLQQSPRRLPSGNEKPLSAGVRWSYCMKTSRTTKYFCRPFLKPASRRSHRSRRPYQHQLILLGHFHHHPSLCLRSLRRHRRRC
jgi:hypothetical protein